MTAPNPLNRTVLFVALEGGSLPSPSAPDLKQNGYRMCEATSAQTAVEVASHLHPIAILLETDNMGSHALNAIGDLYRSNHAPILILSASEDAEDKVAALDHGAADYLTKPFGVSELLARIRARSRDLFSPRAAAKKSSLFRCGALTVDLASHIVKVGAQSVNLTPTEFRLLGLLIRHAGEVLSYRQIVGTLWRKQGLGMIRSLRVHISSLRNKIEPDPDTPSFVITAPGIGYRLALHE